MKGIIDFGGFKHKIKGTGRNAVKNSVQCFNSCGNQQRFITDAKGHRFGGSDQLLDSTTVLDWYFINLGGMNGEVKPIRFETQNLKKYAFLHRNKAKNYMNPYFTDSRKLKGKVILNVTLTEDVDPELNIINFIIANPYKHLIGIRPHI